MDFSLISSPIRSFQSMVQCASAAAESLPKEDLFIAFRASLSLLEKIGELMCNSFVCNQSSPQTNSFVKTNMNIDQNSFLNSFNHTNPNVVFTQSSPGFRQQESILFSNRISFPSTDTVQSSCILPIVSSTPTLAALNGLMKNGILSNSEGFLNYKNLIRSETVEHEDTKMATTSSEDHAEMKQIYHNKKHSSDPAAVTTELNWSGCMLSPPVTTTTTLCSNEPDLITKDDLIKHISRIPPPSIYTFSKSRPERRKSLNSDELNKLLDSCEVQTDGGNGKKNYKCKFCGKTYEIKSSIRYHIRIIHLKMHLKTADMQCKLCGRIFTCATAANKHQLRCVKGGDLGWKSGSQMADYSRSPVEILKEINETG